MRFEPIIPKRFDVGGARVRGQIERRMRTFAADAWKACAAYEPPPTPTYVRTLALKRSWNRTIRFVGRDLVAEVRSAGSTARYNIYVKGPKGGRKGQRQAAHMAARGWRSITDIMDQLWPNTRRDILRIVAKAK